MTKKFTFKFFMLCLLFFNNSYDAFTQGSITGFVYDNELNDPLIGASVHIKGTSLGTITDLNGKFILESPDSTTILIISYTGFTKKEVVVKELDELIIRLSPTRTITSEVRITASRRREKTSEAPASISVIRAPAKPAGPRGVAEAMSRDISTIKNVSLGTVARNIKSGTLTAGEINDFSKWDLWEDIAKEDLEEWQRHWQFKPLERYAVQLTNDKGFPIIDAKASLVNQNGQIIHQTRTDNTGKAELWVGLFADKAPTISPYKIIIDYGKEQYNLVAVKSFQNGINTLKLPTPCKAPSVLDIMMVVDATGSMGDELLYLKTELTDVIKQTQAKHKDLSINLGSVVYRDHEEEYLTRKTDFSTTISKTISFLEKQSADGGGDHPEAVEHALSTAIDSAKWSTDAVARLLFLVLDAPPHHSPAIVQKLHQLAKKAAEKGIKIIPVTGSGIGKSTEYLMRCLSLTTNGTYVFLTDDSGIGNPHIAPTTDTYKVEFLNELLVRLINQYTTIVHCEQPIATLKQEEKVDNKTELAKKLGLKIYPNPTTGPLTISAKKAISETFLTDISGKILARFPQWKKGKNAIHLGQYPSGIYFLQFKTSEGIISKKVLVNHQMIASTSSR